MAEISLLDKLRCIERELAMRHHLYPKWVAAEKITLEKAAREIAIMEAIRAEYARAVEEEKRAGEGGEKDAPGAREREIAATSKNRFGGDAGV